jgi:hypothetical protein
LTCFVSDPAQARTPGFRPEDAPSYRSWSLLRFRLFLSFRLDPLSSSEVGGEGEEGTRSYFAAAGFGAGSSSEEGLSGGGRDEEVVGGMLREEASKEKLGFGRNWDTSVGAESGKRGKREEEEVVGWHGSHPPPAEKPAAGVVVGGEYSGEGSMTAC